LPDEIQFISFTSYAVDSTNGKVLGRVKWFSSGGVLSRKVQNAIESRNTVFEEPEWRGYAAESTQTWLRRTVFDGTPKNVIEGVRSGGTYEGNDFDAQNLLLANYPIKMVGK
jgi:hypothetical protein